MAIKVLKNKKLLWYYISSLGEEEILQLKKEFKFHPLDIRDCLGEPQQSKVDVYKRYLFLIFQFPQVEKEKLKININQLYIFLSKDYLVTITKVRFKPLNNFFYRLINNKKFKEEIFSQDSGFLLYRILDYLYRYAWLAPQYLSKEIDQVEKEIYERIGSIKTVKDLALVRRSIMQFQSIISPQRLVLKTLENLNKDFFSKEELEVYFSDLSDLIGKINTNLEVYKDRVLGLHDINESLISHRTNLVMRSLTVISVSLLPLTLLAGIYGMNINLPLAHEPIFVWGMFGVFIIGIVLIIGILKRRGWL